MRCTLITYLTLTSSACLTFNKSNKQYKQFSGHVTLFFGSDNLSKLSMISSNHGICELLCLQVYDLKEDTNNDEKSQHESETKCAYCGVSMLCRYWRHNSEILISCDRTSENVLLKNIDISDWMKWGKRKRETKLIRLLY
jgi:hypothetical protein